MIETFPNWNQATDHVKNAILSFDTNKDEYLEHNRILDEIKQYGFTYDYDLGGSPYNLKSLNELKKGLSK